MHDLQDYIWMRQQWRSFRHILIGALVAILVLSLSGLLLLHDDQEPARWFIMRLALLLTIAVATPLGFWVKAGREIRDLSRWSPPLGSRMHDKRRARRRGDGASSASGPRRDCALR